MANQGAILQLQGAKTGPRGLRMVLVDSDGGAATFTDYGAASSWVADDDYQIVGIQGSGTTAPATALYFQLKSNGIDKSLFINGASVFDPTSSAAERLGAALGVTIGRGSTIALTGRA